MALDLKWPRWSAMAVLSGLAGSLHRQTKLLGRWQASWHIHLSIGVILTAMCLSIVGIDPKSATTVPAWSCIAYALFYTTAIWFWTFGILGVALRFCSQESQVRRYLADSHIIFISRICPSYSFCKRRSPRCRCTGQSNSH